MYTFLSNISFFLKITLSRLTAYLLKVSDFQVNLWMIEAIKTTDTIIDFPLKLINGPSVQITNFCKTITASLITFFLEIIITQIEASVTLFGFVNLIHVSQFLENEIFSIEMDPRM